MSKPVSAAGYSQPVTEACERVLVTLVRGLGPWKESIYLIGGLTPRYLVQQPLKGVPHIGTTDVDIVVELEMLADTDAYHTLEENLTKLGFERGKNKDGKQTNWRWEAKTEDGITVVLELLADNPKLSGGRVKPLPTEGNISALNIPHSSMVFDHHIVRTIRAPLLKNGGIAEEKIRHADIVTFLCLKAFALDQRKENKDAYDVIFCLENFEGGAAAVADAFKKAQTGKYANVIERAVEIFRKRFADDEQTEGYLKDGAVMAAEFDGLSDREGRVLRQRQATDAVTAFLDALK